MRIRNTLALLFLVIYPAFNQVQLGLNVGYSNYRFSDPAISNAAFAVYSYTPALPSFAFSIQQRTAKPFNLGAEIRYLNRRFNVNSTISSPGSNTLVNITYKLNTIDLILKPQFVFGNTIKFIVSPGIYAGFLYNSTATGSETTVSVNNPHPDLHQIDGNANSYYPATEYGLLVGLAIEIPLQNNFGLFLEPSFTSHFENVGKAWRLESTILTSVDFRIGITYTFNNILSISGDNPQQDR